ncbi:hypothetical protein [Aeromonas veronii]|uniref:hypothetical protein n=1 Tax=Aeromonas veronii TaxID=654 RepID=UPI0018F157B5|nr:hypothetical protein [Aeromonas veronii]MBJ7591490.1 hypothetical protein [Aeromonas veronii]
MVSSIGQERNDEVAQALLNKIRQEEKSEAVAKELLSNIIQDLDSYKPLRVKLFEHTERYKKGFLESPGTLGLTAIGAASSLVGFVALPAAAGPAVVIGAFAVAGAAVASMAANYIVNRIANPILQHFVSKGFEPKSEIEKVQDLIDKSLSQNKNLSEYDKSKVFDGISSHIKNMSEKLLTVDVFSNGRRTPSSYESGEKLSSLNKALEVGYDAFKRPEKLEESDEAAQALLDKIVKDLDSYKPLRVKLYEHTERFKNGIIDAPGSRGLALVSAVGCLAAVAAIPAGAGSAVVMGAFAIAGAAQVSIAANYIVNRIANPILKFFASKGFDPKAEMEKVQDLIDVSVNQNRKIAEKDKEKVLSGVSSYIKNMSVNLLTKEHRYGDRFPTSDSNENKLSWINNVLDKGFSKPKVEVDNVAQPQPEVSSVELAANREPLRDVAPPSVDDMARRIAELEAALRKSDDEKEELQERLNELDDDRPSLKM